MGDAGYFRGTSSEQDNRFSDKEKKLLKQMKFADSITKKVDIKKVKLDVIKPWISSRISEILGMEDDVLVEFVSNQLEAENFPDGRRIQINLTGFLNGKNARIFTGELWDLLISAQEQDSGIPPSILEARKEEMKQKQEDKQKVKETVERTLGHFLPREGIKKEKASPPPHMKDSSGDGNRSSSDTFSRYRDNDRGDRKGDRENQRHGTRQYRTRRSRSHSHSPSQPKTRDRSRDRVDKNRRDRRGDDRDNAAPTPQQIIDAARERDRRERERNRTERYRGGGTSRGNERGRRYSPQRSWGRSSPDSSRNKHRTEGSPPAEDGRQRKRSPEVKTKPKDLESNESGSSSAESDVDDEPKKKKTRTTSMDDSSDRDTSSPKSKKKKKKSKKHKKHKKAKKEMKGPEESSSQDDMDADEQDEVSKSRDELERSLRERALASMKKRKESETSQT